MSVSQGLSDQKSELEKKLAFAEQLLQGVATATQELLTVSNYRDSIQSSLAILGASTQVDRVYIFRYDSPPTTQIPIISQCWEWVAAGITPEIDNPELQNLPFHDLLPRWYRELSQDRVISGLIETFPEAERQILEPQNIISIVVVPILIQAKFWGFMGFDDCHRGHVWSESEVAALKAVAHSFGGAFARHEAECNLKSVNQVLKAQATDLKEVKELADRANQAKNTFLANMSHELRTPLNGILGYTQILGRSERLNPREKRGITVIHKCATHLLTLINDILDLTKIEAEKLELAPEAVKLSKFLEDIIAICQIGADLKSIDLVMDLETGLPQTVAVDVKRLRQVLLNLLSNAIKFTDQGRVILQVSQLQANSVTQGLNSELLGEASSPKSCHLRFTVKDTGIGIAPEDMTRLFIAFEQVGDPQRQVEGTGLGLNISQRIIQAMGSKIEVQSIPGQGSIFFFDLKLRLIDNAQLPTQSAEDPHDLDMQLTHDAPINVEHQSMAFPPNNDLKQLLELAQQGRIKRLIELAQRIEATEPRYTAFSQHIIKLAKQFETEAIETLLTNSPHP